MTLSRRGAIAASGRGGVAGTITAVLPAVTQAVSVSVSVQPAADIAATIPAVTQAATVTVTAPSATADIAATIPAITQAATGSVEITADIAATIPAVEQATAATVASSFSPDDVIGLEYWFAADEIVGLSDNDSVTQWDDLSGNARHLQNETGETAPVYKTNRLNGLPAVYFDGTNRGLVHEDATLDLGNDNTIFVVLKRTGSTTRTYAFDSNPGGGGANKRHLLALTRTGNVAIYAGAWLVGPSEDTDAHVYTCNFFGGGSVIRDGGVQQVSGGAGVGSLANGFIIGGPTQPSGTGDYMVGDIHELLVYDATVTGTDRDDIEQYLLDKWGFP